MRVEPKIGSEFAGHRIEAVIGRGGASAVYLAEHLRLGRKVALKVLDPEIAEDEAFRERFIRESRIAAGLDHPNIITVYDAGEAEGILFISMRYVEGADLERVLRSEGSLDAVRTISIVSQCAAALDVAHAEGLVHRDVKPANILLAPDGRGAEHVYLTDFGITKRKRSAAGPTRTGQFVGSVDYVAPEQILGKDVDARADVYALGCVLFRSLTGDVPFPRDSEVGTIYGHLQDVPPAATARDKDLPAAIDPVIARALAKPRDERFATCGALASAAGEALGVWVGAPVPRAVSPTEGPRATRAIEGARHLVRRRRRIAVAVLVALSIVSIAVIVTVSLVRGSGGARRTGASTGPSPPRVVKATWKEPPYISSVFGGKGDQDMARALNLRADRIVLSVGHDDSSGDRDAAVWTSRQRLVHWRQVRDPALRTPGEQLMSGAALLDDTVVAVGWERLSDETDAAVWTSDAAGASWGRVPGASSGLHRPADQKMHRVISPDTGLVAVGSDSASGDLDAAVWTSPDGTHWNLSDLRADGDQDAFGVTQFGQALVLVGYTTTDSDDEDAAVWVRSGDSWSSPNDPSLVDEGDQRMISVIQVGSKLVAVGTTEVDGNRDAAVWTSMNGQDWVRVPDPSGSLGGPGDQQMFAVTLVRSTLVAGGVSGLPSGGTDAAVWMSTDGTQWIREDSLDPRASVFGGPKGQQIKSIVPFEDSLVAVGSAIRERDNGAEVWYARIPSGF